MLVAGAEPALHHLDPIHVALLAGAFIALAGILSSLIGTRFGAPLLLVFLGVGMLAGEDGPGGIAFSDYGLTYLVGSGALAIILFDGGLRMRVSRLRGALAPAALLATLGVLVTAAVVGLAAEHLLGLSTLEGLLLGAIVASTDAAAVFFLLRTGGLQLRPRVGSILELESGTNDPAALFLVLVLTELILLATADPGAAVALHLAQQAVVGTLLGVGGGLGIVWLLNRVTLPDGLHPLLVVVAAVFVYALSTTLGGSGFLAAYLAGLVVGNRPVRAFPAILSFHDAATWLCQMVMFVMLGLLVTPSRMVDFALPALAVALVLMFVARPLAVALCLVPFRVPRREIGFTAWVGLRGAVSIFLAAIPTLSAVPHAAVFFNVAFVVVIISLAVQGWTVGPAARRFAVALPNPAPPSRRVELDLPGQLGHEMAGFPVEEGSPVLAGRALPEWARMVMVVRDGAVLTPPDIGDLRAGDYAYLLAPQHQVQRLDRLFATATSGRPPFGELPLHGGATLGALASAYNLEVPAEQTTMTIADFVAAAGEGTPEPGDQFPLGEAAIVVRRVEGGRVTLAGLQIAELTIEPGPLSALLARARDLLRRRKGGI